MLIIKISGKLPKMLAAQDLLDKTVAVLTTEAWSGSSKMAILEQSNAKLKIAVRIVDALEMRKINHDVRGKNYATDVLSWGLWEDGMWPGQEEIGEVLICGEVAESQAGENNWNIEQELGFLLVHGLLHVFGLDHEKGKQQWEEQFGLHQRIMPEVSGMIARLRKEMF